MPVPSGVRVVALAAGEAISRADLAEAQRGTPVLATTETNSDGEFALTSLREGSYYALYAGGQGFLYSPTFAPPVVAGEDQAVTLHALYCYGMAVLPRVHASSDISTHGDLGLVDCSPVHTDVHRAYYSKWTLDLCGLETPFDLLTGRRDTVFLFQSEYLFHEGVAVEALADIPGYPKARLEATAPWLQKPHVPTLVLPIDAGTSAFGSISVRLEPAAAGEAVHALSSWHPKAGLFLSLASLTEGDVPLEGSKILLRLDETGTVSIAGIPEGRYSYEAWTYHKQYRSESRQDEALVVSSDHPADAVLSIHGYGALELDFSERPGGAPLGVVAGMLTDRGSSEAIPFQFAGPPFVVPLLRPGEYDLSLQLPASAAQEHRLVSVYANQRSLLVLE